MLCEICWRMLRGQVGRQWRGTYDLHFDHHHSIETLKASHNMGCGICRVLHEELIASSKKDIVQSDEEQVSDEVGNAGVKTDLSAHSTALLGVINDIEDRDVFRLDFKLEWARREHHQEIIKRTFVLKQTDSSVAAFRTPMSEETSSGEVFKLALSWITQCDQKCNPPCSKSTPNWYPTRLIDIRDLKSKEYLETRRKRYTGNAPSQEQTLRDLNKTTVRLVERPPNDVRHGRDVFGETVENDKQPNNLYVTLSHCWGPDPTHYTLTPKTEGELKAGIEIQKLPQTFRDAVNFASQLHNVGWIWIDSLCIYQRRLGASEEDNKVAEKDWLHEAALMQRVYQESYLNVSATAASNSDEGLYSERDYRNLWENEVSLKVDGIPGLALHDEEHNHNEEVSTVRPKNGHVGSSFWKWFTRLFHAPTPESLEEAEPVAKPVAKIDWGGEKPLTMALPEPEGLRRCVIIDTSHWEDLVNRAPVNVRAWVLQERLLAPRVLHFCKGSIAWECGQFTRAEGHPTGLPRFQLQHDRILPEVPLKGLDPFKHGKELRRIRLGDSKEPDPEMPEKDLYGFELWARVVEMYSRMNLTISKDKLIALSGIAQLMSTNILGSKEVPARYVAGLWYKYLESQLLWRVEPIFKRHNQTFHQPSGRPETFRAPSFSWASVDAQYGIDDQPGNGITYGEVTDQDLLIDLQKGENDVVIKTQTENEFGLVDWGHIMLYGKLRKIRLSRGERGRFYWQIVDRNLVCPNIDKERHHNVYLDAPDDDDKRQRIFKSHDVYCLPAARGPRSEDKESKYIICLILQQAADDDQVKDLTPLEKKGTFRRVGLTKLSGWGDKLTYEHILTPHAGDVYLPQWPHAFDTTTNRHLVRII
ncbi:hypothetical protein INS49_003331 [Diaporthe citri]|uniref:uncharacterized protein n=1 Tax=Diaporthe citri TaxID=83186 RepID=UPI001C817503|nr:uncharacterized protein INS49_003331 [Diaporthe citri]KAG6355369.1 hypothetical protein INS49_003331 [Diaporthe citri]